MTFRKYTLDDLQSMDYLQLRELALKNGMEADEFAEMAGQSVRAAYENLDHDTKVQINRKSVEVAGKLRNVGPNSVIDLIGKTAMCLDKE